MDKLEFDNVKGLVYDQIQNILRLYADELYTDKLKNDIENKMEALVKPLKDSGSIYDYVFNTSFDEAKNTIDFNFAFKREKTAEFTVAKFSMTHESGE